MAESPAKGWRPLEPDAGNAAEGSEGPMPDWDFQPCDFSRMVFVCMRDNLETRKPRVILVRFFMESWLPDSSVLL